MDRDDARMVALILAGHDQCPRAGILQSGRTGMPPASYGFEGEQLVVGGHRFELAELRGALARLRAMFAAADAQMDLFVTPRESALVTSGSGQAAHGALAP